MKPHFREPLRSPNGFIGRDPELARLVSIVRGRRAATVLVAGHRGVGKTSLVNQAIGQAKDASLNRITVSLPLPGIAPSRHASEIRELILRSLARALYFSLRSEDLSPSLQRKLSKLHAKISVTELEEQRAIHSIVETQFALTKSNRTETSFRPSRALGITLSTLVGGGIGLGGAHALSSIVEAHGQTWGVLAAASIVLAAAVTAFTFNHVNNEEENKTERLTDEEAVTEIGKLDLSPEALEFELTDLLQHLEREGYSCVFVIDELDKLDVNPRVNLRPHDHVIFRIVSSLKNFFTLGSGIFVFISGEEFFRSLRASMDQVPYSIAHTLFTDAVFVRALHYSDVEILIDNMLIEVPTDPADLANYRRFRNYLCWLARNHVFDLLTLVTEYVRYERGVPFLLAEEPGDRDGRWREGSLPPNWQIAAGLQKVLGAAYDESARPFGRDEYFNQVMWSVLRDIAEKIFSGADVVPTPSLIEAVAPNVKQLSGPQFEDITGAVERFLLKLERYGIADTDLFNDSNGSAHSAPRTVFRLAKKPQYPPKAISTESTRIPIEEAFLVLADTIGAIRSRATVLKDYAFIDSLAASIRNISPRRTVPRSVVRLGFLQADKFAMKLATEEVAKEVDFWVQDNGYEKISNLEDVHFPELASSGLVEPTLWRSLFEATFTFFLITSPAMRYPLLIVFHPSNSEENKLLNAQQQSARRPAEAKSTKGIKVVELILDGRGGQRIDRSVLEELRGQGQNEFPFTSSLISPKPTRRRHKVGWVVFNVDSRLQNLRELSRVLTRASQTLRK